MNKLFNGNKFDGDNTLIGGLRLQQLQIHRLLAGGFVVVLVGEAKKTVDDAFISAESSVENCHLGIFDNKFHHVFINHRK